VNKTWMDGQDDYCGSLAYILAHLAKRKKWITSLDDLSSQSSTLDTVHLEVLPAPAAPKAKAKGAAKAKGKAAPAVMSAAKLRDEASKDIGRDRKRTCHTLHFVLQNVASKEFVGEMREVCLALGAESKAHSHYTSQVLSPTQTREYFASMADFGYMQQVRAALETLGDTVALRRCGYIVDIEVAEALTLDAPCVIMEDSRAQKYIGLLMRIFKHRTS
jgi:hypothetical protein